MILGKWKIWLLVFVALVISTTLYFGLPQVYSQNYSTDRKVLSDQKVDESPNAILGTQESARAKAEPVKKVITHLKTPEPVKGLYMTSWVAGTTKIRNNIVDLVDITEANSIIIDIKDYTGKISFAVENPELQEVGSSENRIPDIVDFIESLHKKNIYVIGRLSVFQDPYFIKIRPELAVKTNTNKNTPWKDKKGISWLDAGAEDVWHYVESIAEEAYSKGFDEINFDYVRYPSDGNMRDIYYPISQGKIKSEVLKSFFVYITDALRAKGIKTSVDLFGMTTTNTDDLNIGQILENALLYFDYVCPMVYPSHFPPTWNGFKSPAKNPYEVVSISMGKAVERALAIPVDSFKLRPWLQDFNLGANYTSDMVRAQIKATYDVGLTSWMLWDAANTYTKDALDKEDRATLE